MKTVADYKYLWDGSSSAWVLLRINGDEPDEKPRYSIFNTETRGALLISDDTTYDEVKEMMIAKGVRIVSPAGTR